MMNLTPYVAIWIVLATLVLGLALYRRILSINADNYVHLSQGEAQLIPRQIQLNHRLNTVDRWGEVLTVVTLFAGIALASAYVYLALHPF
jgi:hypothetical protein